ncbi:SGNH/GDSL hydrolase family protein [Rhodococcus opacus]|uniref:SGNH/GDSL hydrolase family protein n=1 Tax=Rhodococcus opacus TaxID=37919 RepID=UPI0034D211C9
MIKWLRGGKWTLVIFFVIAVVVVAAGVVYDMTRTSPNTSTSAEQASLPNLNPPASSPKFAVIGDSYSIPNTNGDHWPALLAFDRRWFLSDFAIGGTGYVQGNAEKNKLPFGSQIDKVAEVNPELVLVVGGRNDVSHSLEVRDATRDLFAQLRDRLPGAKVVVVGPIMDSKPPSPTAVMVNDRIRAAAEQYRLPFIDALSGNWLSDPALLREDGMHPNPDGHRVLFERINEQLHALGI